jgi:hypothetical protein
MQKIHVVALGALASTVLFGCPVPDPPPPPAFSVGTIVGEVFVADPDPVSVSDATVQVYGTSRGAVSEAGKQFVLQGVPLGGHTLLIDHAPSGRSRRVPVALGAAFQTLLLDDELTTLGEPASVSGMVTAPEDTADAEAFLVGGNGEQKAEVGDNGSFTIPGLPTGPAQIAITKPGFDTALVELDLEEGANDVGAVTLEATTEDALSLSGRALLEGRTDHRGTVVTLNGGEHVATTDERGDYSFSGLTPGLYAVEASQPGYVPARLPQVALIADGQAYGLVNLYLGVGTEVPDVNIDIQLPDAGPGGEPPSIDIANPRSGDVLTAGVPYVLAADTAPAELTVDDQEIIWRLRDAGATDAGIEVGRGSLITNTFEASAYTALELVVELEQSGVVVATDVVPIFVDVLLGYEVKTGFDSLYDVGAPTVEQVPGTEPGETITRYTIYEGQPVEIRPEVDAVESRTSWLSDTGYAFVGRADLSTLPAGTHVFTLTVTGDSGAVSTSTVEVVVVGLVFDLSVALPEEAPSSPYFVDTGVPLQVTVSHSFQNAFPAGAITWRDLDGAVLAQGPTGRIYPAAGSWVISVEAIDLNGARRTATAEFTVQEVQFDVFFEVPATNIEADLGDAVDFRVGFSHDAAMAADISVRLISDKDGGLQLDDGRATVLPGEDVAVSSLTAGLHRITARANDGQRVTEAEVEVQVLVDYVAGVKISPLSPKILTDGEPAVFEVFASATEGITPVVTWYLDGTELDTGWGDYTQGSNQVSVDLGTYQTDTAPYDDARWDPGVHELVAFVRLPAVPESPGCRDIPDQASCLRFPVTVVEEADAIDTMTIAAGQTEVWSGTRLLRGIVTLDGGTLIVQPGTTILVDTGPTGAPTSLNSRRLRLLSGVAQIGGSEATEPVIFQAVGPNAGLNSWYGVDANANTGGAYTISNVIMRHARYGFYTSHVFDNSPTTLTLGPLTFEDVGSPITIQCHSLLERITARRTGRVIDMGSVGGPSCAPTTVIRDIVAEEPNANGWAIAVQPYYNSPADILVEDVDLSGNGLYLNPGAGGSSTVRNSSVAAAGVLANACVDFANGTGGDLLADDNHFEGCPIGIELRGSARDATLVRNHFVDGTRGIRFGAADAGAQTHIHGNVFLGNAIDLDASSNQPDVHAEGNFVGTAGDSGSLGATLFASPPGVHPASGRVTDGIDNASNGVVRMGNPLALPFTSRADAPVAVILEPARTRPYGGQQCIPVRAFATIDDVDLAADCRWSSFTAGGDPAQGTALTIDADGCIDGGLSDGVHGIALTCDELAQDGVSVVRSTIHTTEVLVDSTAWRGTLTQDTTWSGTVSVDGDVIVPSGVTLTIDPGTEVLLEADDVLRSSRRHQGVYAARLGYTQRPDFFIDGALVVAGASGDEAELRQAFGLPVTNSWGSIVAGHNATVDLSHAAVRGASNVFVGQATVDDATTAPSISVADTELERTGIVFYEVCPTLAERLVGDDVSGFIVGACFADTAISDSTFTNTGSTARVNYAFDLRVYTGGVPVPPHVTIERSSFSGTATYYWSYSRDLGLLTVDQTDVLGFPSVHQGDHPVTVSGSVFDDFTTGFYNATSLTVDDSVFVNGTYAIYTPDAALVTNSLFRDTDTVFYAVASAAVQANGNHIENVSTFVHANNYQASYPGLDVSGNNIVNAGTAVLASGADGVSIDATGCYWGVTTEPEIEALIDDDRTDASPTDDVVGDTSYAGWSATPLSLTVPTYP